MQYFNELTVKKYTCKKRRSVLTSVSYLANWKMTEDHDKSRKRINAISVKRSSNPEIYLKSHAAEFTKISSRTIKR